MKKQIVSMMMFVICFMFVGTEAMAQGVVVYKKNGEVMKVPYEELDSIVTYNDEGEDIIQTEMVQGHECVDLGLSVKWATCNVGANSPEESGDYYAWGETSTKSEYSWKTYKWCNGTGRSLTKYCDNSTYGNVDHKTVLDKSDDVAYVRWGNKWRIPTHEEFEELCDKCQMEETTLKGINGVLITAPNGNSIFLPYSGWYTENGLNYLGKGASYWGANVQDVRSYDASRLFRTDYDISPSYSGNRCFGFPVRPVTE